MQAKHSKSRRLRSHPLKHTRCESRSFTPVGGGKLLCWYTTEIVLPCQVYATPTSTLVAARIPRYVKRDLGLAPVTIDSLISGFVPCDSWSRGRRYRKLLRTVGCSLSNLIQVESVGEGVTSVTPVCIPCFSSDIPDSCFMAQGRPCHPLVYCR